MLNLRLTPEVHVRRLIPTSSRRLRVAALMSVLLITALPGIATAATLQLTGEFLYYTNSGGISPEPPLSINVGTVEVVQLECPTEGNGSFEYTATGNANGPFPGTFSVHGSGTIVDHAVTGMSGTFEIRDMVGTLVATGQMDLIPGHERNGGTCSQGYLDYYDEAGNVIGQYPHLHLQARGAVQYSAEVTANGTTSSETGYAIWGFYCDDVDGAATCDTSESSTVYFYGESLPRQAEGENGTASTGTEATETDPIATTILNPAGGYVSLTETAVQPDPDGSWVYLGREVYIYTDYPATVEQPIVLTFVIDASLLVGLDPQTVTVMRDGVPVEDCSGPDGHAVPDPCVDSRTVDGNGDLTLVVLTSQASLWSVVSPVTVPSYVFQGFQAPVDNPGADNVRNVVKAGQAVPLHWRIVNDDGTPVLDATSATVTVSSFACGLSETADNLEEVATGESGLRNLGDGYYALNWATPKSYADSCKELTLAVFIGDDAVSATALFEFRR